MEEFLQNPLWWVFSVIIVGMGTSLAASYLKPQIDNAFSRVSKSRREAVRRNQELLDRRVRELLANPNEVINLKTDQIRDTLRVVLIIVVGLYIFNALSDILIDFIGLWVRYNFTGHIVVSFFIAIVVPLAIITVLMGPFSNIGETERVLRHYYEIRENKLDLISKDLQAEEENENDNLVIDPGR